MWRRAAQEGVHHARDPLQGVRLGQEGASRGHEPQLHEGRQGRFDLRHGRWVEGQGGRLRGVFRERGIQGTGWSPELIRRADDLDRSGEGFYVEYDLGQFVRLSEQGRLTMAAPIDWITLAEASAILQAANIRFQPETIGRWARSGRLQSIKLGGRRYVRRGEVKALVAAPRRVRAEEVQPVLFEEWRG